MLTQLQSHLMSNDILEKFQSGFKSQPGCVSLVLQCEAAGSLIAPGWLAAVQVINPALSM